MNIALILAGGIGSRLGAEIPKQFVEVLGRPVLAYTIQAFQKHPLIDAIEVVCLESYIEELQKIKEKYHFTKLRWVAKGGATFQESVLNGIYHLEGKISDDDQVLVHFGASPFVSEEIITDCIEVCKKKGNAISTTNFFLLSGIKTDETMCNEWIDRETIACMNSPHAFRFGFIDQLYREAEETGVINEVEPHTTTLMNKMGKPIYFSKGSQTNIKLTQAEDVGLFEGYLLMKQKHGQFPFDEE